MTEEIVPTQKVTCGMWWSGKSTVFSYYPKKIAKKSLRGHISSLQVTKMMVWLRLLLIQPSEA